MQKQVTKTNSIKNMFDNPKIKERIENLLNEKSSQFITSVLSLANNNPKIAECEPNSVLTSALTATSLNLPINQNLGYAYFIPYRNNAKGISEVQFQIGFKGFIQLALRTAFYKHLSVTEIYEGQLIDENPLTGYVFDFSIKSEKVIGYASYFKLTNGFEKTFYMSKEQVEKHAKKYSKNYHHSSSLWKTDFDTMAKKTVLKLLISKYGILSIELEKSLVTDQSIIQNEETLEVSYPDNPNTLLDVTPNQEEEQKRIISFIEKAETLEDLQGIKDSLSQEEFESVKEVFSNRENEIVLTLETK